MTEGQYRGLRYGDLIQWRGPGDRHIYMVVQPNSWAAFYAVPLTKKITMHGEEPGHYVTLCSAGAALWDLR